MLFKSKAVAINHFRYNDNSFIAHVLTDSHGKIPLLIRSGKSKHTQGKHVYFQPLYLLEIDIDFKENRELQYIKSLKPIEVLHHISTDIRKQSIALFLAEVLQKSIKNQEIDKSLFQFVFHSVKMFEQMKANSSIFHHYFLSQLMKYLGFEPGNSYSDNNEFLDTEAGLFVNYHQTSSVCLSKEESKLIDFFINISAEELSEIHLNRTQKTQLLEGLILYYGKHIPGFEKLNSYQILKEVFIR